MFNGDMTNDPCSCHDRVPRAPFGPKGRRYFDDGQRQATKAAGTLAGLEAWEIEATTFSWVYRHRQLVVVSYHF